MNDQHEMDEPDVFDGPPRVTNADMPEPPHPVNWNLLTAHELEQEWLALNRWVDWLRRTYGLTVAVVPPFWHHLRNRQDLWMGVSGGLLVGC